MDLPCSCLGVAGKARRCGRKESRDELVKTIREPQRLNRKTEEMPRVPTSSPLPRRQRPGGHCGGGGGALCSSSAHASQRDASLLTHPWWALAWGELPRSELGEAKGRASSPPGMAGVIYTHHLLSPHHNLIIPTLQARKQTETASSK